MEICMDELLYIIDKNDSVLRSENRKDVHSSNLWHRGVHVILRNRKRQIVLQVRCQSKDKFPNKLDVSVSEHVVFNESYEDAAHRGLLEELGVKTRLRELVHFRMQYGQHDFTVGKLFTGKCDDKLKPSSETSKIISLSEKKLLKKMEKEKNAFAPWALELLRYYFKQPNKLTILTR